MIIKKYIEKNLNFLNKQYNASIRTNPEEALFYSKLAIIELCGWLEESIDELCRSYIKINIKEKSCIDFCNSKISNTYGFEYDKHIRSLLVIIVGIKNLETIEKKLESQNGFKAKFKSIVNSLYSVRNSLSHTHLSSIRRIDSPQITIKTMKDLYEILKKIEKMMKLLN